MKTRTKALVIISSVVIVTLAYSQRFYLFFPGADGKYDSLRKECKDGNMDRCSMLGLHLKQDGQYDQARWLWKKACNGGAAYGCFGLGTLLEKDGQLNEANSLYKKACDLDPKDRGVEACLRLQAHPSDQSK